MYNLFSSSFLVFIHDPEDQQYMATALVTDDLPFIDFQPGPGTAGMYIDVLKHREISINRKNNFCKDYKGGIMEYNECVKDFMWSNMHGNMTCKYPGTFKNVSAKILCSLVPNLFIGTELYLPKNVTLAHCNNGSSALSALEHFAEITLKDPQVKLYCIGSSSDS